MALTAILVLGLLPAAAGRAQQQQPCLGQPSAANVPQRPGPALRFGITPGVQTGQLGTGPQPPRTPEDPAKQLAALHELVPPGVPFVLRLHRLFWSDGEAAVQHFRELADRYTGAGYQVELQLRYHPSAQQEGDIAAWTAFVRHVVDVFGPNRRVVAIQVTNEVNLPDSPDSSDGAYRGGRDALIQGVIAAKDEARARGYGQLAIGFNWAYRYTPQGDQQFWDYLRDQGGPRFAAALDWVGLDVYPGTFIPPADTPGGERDAIVNALSTLRCYTQGAGILDAKPIHVEENGWPTSPTRSYDRQAQALETMVRAFHDFRGTFGVSDYRWFDLRDSDSTSPNFQQQYGLMTDEYVPKPAFARYRALVDELSVRAARPGTPRRRSRPTVSVRCRRGLWIVKVAARGAARVDFLLDGHLATRDRRRPFRRALRARPGSRHVLTLVVVTSNHNRYRVKRRLRSCPRPETTPGFAG